MSKNELYRLLFLSLSLLPPSLLFGQYYNLGQDPATLKWRQINTRHFRIVYPEEFESKAQKMMPAADFMYLIGTNSLGFKPAKIPVILHTYNITSNAVTGWAPKRVEMYTNTPQDSYAQNWLDQLMLHEYRHVIQIDRTNQGFTKALSWLLGEQAATGINGLFVPSWYMEGDAVCSETAFSKSGRGRIPNFEMPLRAQVTKLGANSYDRAAFGSFKKFVPDRYTLGYTLVANVRRKYGYQTWISALDKVARQPYILTPFNRALKESTGFTKEKLYKISMTEMDSMWRNQDEATTKTSFSQLTHAFMDQYENYIFPHYLNDSIILSIYSNLDDIARFVIVDRKGQRKVVTTPGYFSSENFSVTQFLPAGKNISYQIVDPDCVIAWTETVNDYRWQQRNYSVIRIYNSNSHKIKSLTSKSRYFAPAFSPDGNLLAAISSDATDRYSIVIIDVDSGTEKTILHASDSNVYMTPAWSEDGSKVVYTQLDRNGKSLHVFDLSNNTDTILLPSTFTEISNPRFAKEFVLFNGAYSGIENIYSVHLKSKEIYQVTSAEFGASNAELSPDCQKIVYSNYLASGYGLAEADFNPVLWKPLNEVTDPSPSLYKYLVKEEGVIYESGKNNQIQYKSEPYKKAAHIFNFHSWAPAYINYMAGENGAGISFMSQNELSTATTIIGYKFNMAENSGKVTADFSWKAWYPLIDLNASYGGRTAITQSDVPVKYTFNETIISGGITLPMIFTGGKYYKGFNLQLHTSFNGISNNTSTDSTKLTGTFNSLDYSMYAYRYIKQSPKDMYPKWGQAVTFSFRHSPMGNNNIGSILSGGVHLYLPGLFKHHGFRFDLSTQTKYPGQYTYGNQIVLPRGYLFVNENVLSCVAVNYKFPIAYPDLSIGPLAYIKRIKANLFFDSGTGVTKGMKNIYQSTGIEMYSDLHFLRFVFPIELGFRFGYFTRDKRYFSDLLFSVNLPN